MTQNPVKGGRKRNRGMAPIVDRLGSDRSIVKYNVLGNTIITNSTGQSVGRRFYSAGFGTNLLPNAGVNVCGFYNTYVFKPGTSIKWTPSVSFTTSGRLFVGFVDNPEMMAGITVAYDNYVASTTSANYAIYADLVKSLGNTVSFPVWQETQIEFPTRLRRKRFDTNLTQSLDVNIYDRSIQCLMLVAFEGGPAAVTTLGQFSFHDVVDVEGLSSVST